MNYNDFKQRETSLKVFNKVDIMGSYDFETCVVSLDSLEKRDVERFLSETPKINLGEPAPPAFLSSRAFSINEKVLPLAVHEFTHFLDSTCSIWGVNLLAKQNLAYSSNYLLGGLESDFFHAKVFHDFLRGIKLPDYYTTKNPGVHSLTPWGYNSSIGLLFNKDGHLSNFPVIFSRFFNSNRQEFIRSPISTASLLECSAKSQDIFTKSMLLGLCDKHFALVESRLWSKNVFQFLYNSEITEYSVCAHLVANIQNNSEINSTFLLAGALSRVVLNCTKKVYERALETDAVSKVLNFQKGNIFFDRLNNGLSNRNEGILFYILANATPLSTCQNEESMTNGIKIALEKIGSSYDLLEKERMDEINTAAESLMKSKIKGIRKIAEIIPDNAKKIDIFNLYMPFNELNLPPVFLGDGEVFSFFGSENNKLRDLDLNEHIDEMYAGQSWVKNFTEGCLY